MAVYTHLSDEDIQQLLTDYTIGELVSAQPIVEGIDNSNYLLTTTQGKFILTLYEKRLVESELPFYLRLMAYMQENGVSCPSVLMRKDGGLLSKVSGRSISITSFLQGKELAVIEPGHLSEVGALLARMHLTAKDFDEKLVNRLAPNWLMPLYERVKDRLDELDSGLSQQISEELKTFKSWPELNLPRGVVHADVYPDNVFFIDNKVSGVIDFYFACEEYWAYDLAVVLNAWCFDGKDKTCFNIEKSSQLLSAYHQHRPLSEAEQEAFPFLARAMSVRCLLTRACDWFFQVEGAVVKPHDPREYVAKWKFHRDMKGFEDYIL